MSPVLGSLISPPSSLFWAFMPFHFVFIHKCVTFIMSFFFFFFCFNFDSPLGLSSLKVLAITYAIGLTWKVLNKCLWNKQVAIQKLTWHPIESVKVEWVLLTNILKKLRKLFLKYLESIYSIQNKTYSALVFWHDWAFWRLCLNCMMLLLPTSLKKRKVCVRFHCNLSGSL